MTKENKELLEVYMKGFNDCSTGVDTCNQYLDLHLKAYRLGWNHYILGDDVRSVDYLTDEEVLKLIKN